MRLEAVGVVGGSHLGSAEVGGDRVEGGHARDAGLRVHDDLVVLDVEAADLAERARGGVVVSEELRDDSEGLGGVDGHAGAVEGGVAHAERVEVAAVRVAKTAKAVRGRSAIVTSALSLFLDCARVGSEGGGDGVGLPNIHLIATCAHRASSSVGVVGRCRPAFNVGLGA